MIIFLYFCLRTGTNSVGGPSTAKLNMLTQFVFPVECQGVVSCQDQFLQSILRKVKNLGQFYLDIPFEDETISTIQVAFLCVEQDVGEYDK